MTVIAVVPASEPLVGVTLRFTSGVLGEPLSPVISMESIAISSSPASRSMVTRRSNVEPVPAIAFEKDAKVLVTCVPSPSPSKLVSWAGTALKLSPSGMLSIASKLL